MANYSFQKAPSSTPLRAKTVFQAINEEGIEAVKAVTVATHKEPWEVILHCNRELTEFELQQCGSIIDRL